MLWLLAVCCLLACKSTHASNGIHAWKGKMLFCLAVLAAMPAQGTQHGPWFCWWRVRVWDGEFHYVHPSGWFELLPSEYQDCLEEIFQTEPEMAAYIHGLSAMGAGHTPGPFPPHWSIEGQMWIVNRDQPEPRLQYVARPLDCGSIIEGYYPDTDWVSWVDMGDTPHYNPAWGAL